MFLLVFFFFFVRFTFQRSVNAESLQVLSVLQLSDYSLVGWCGDVMVVSDWPNCKRQ